MIDCWTNQSTSKTSKNGSLYNNNTINITKMSVVTIKFKKTSKKIKYESKSERIITGFFKGNQRKIDKKSVRPDARTHKGNNRQARVKAERSGTRTARI